MKTIKRILVPTDFSACAEAASSTALEMARSIGASVTYMHIVEDTGPLHILVHKTAKNGNHDERIGHLRAQLNAWVASAAREGVDAFPLLIMERTRSKIEEFVTKGKYDLIVMGSHGCTGIREWVLG